MFPLLFVLLNGYMLIIMFSGWCNSGTAFWIFFWGFAFGFFNTISAVILSGFLPTNKLNLLISCHALSFPSVSSPTILSAAGTAAASCAEAAAVPCWRVHMGSLCQQHLRQSPGRACPQSLPCCLHLLCSDPILSSRWGWAYMSKNNYPVSLPFSVSFFIISFPPC